MGKGRKKQTPGKTQSITKQAKKAFVAWNKTRKDTSEEFRQCKNPKYWFVSDKGTVISFYKSQEPIYLAIQPNKSGYKYVSSAKGSQYIHRLQAEAFPEKVYAYGKARKHKTLKGLEVHHTESDKRNEPEAEEILEGNTHEILFNKKTVPGIDDIPEKHFEYMQKIAKIAEENTPDQTVVVFSGTGIQDGKATKDLTQVIYADDFPGVAELEETVTAELQKPKLTYFAKDGYIVFYTGTPFTNTVIAKYHKELIAHIKKADQEEHMEKDTRYPIEIKDGNISFTVWTIKM